MKLNISPKEFGGYSGEKKKQYIAHLLIESSGAAPVADNDQPLAIIMAGLPGAGKTEFLDSLSEYVDDAGLGGVVRIDLDEIIAVYPDYTPRDYYKLRSQGNLVLERVVDQSLRGRYNMFVDGTFSGKSGASIKGIERLLSHGYRVRLVYVYDKIEIAWNYTQQRKLETGRDIGLQDFVNASKSMLVNLRRAGDLFGENPDFDISVVVQKELRDKDYYITTQKDDIDKLFAKEYNTDKLRVVNIDE